MRKRNRPPLALKNRHNRPTLYGKFFKLSTEMIIQGRVFWPISQFLPSIIEVHINEEQTAIDEGT